MHAQKLIAVALAGAMALGGGAIALAQTDHPSARIEIMRSNAATLGPARTATGDAAIAAAQTFVSNFTALPEYFTDPSQPGRTSAAAWDDNDGLIAMIGGAREAAEAALAAAEAGDQAGYDEHIGQIAATCGTCHAAYRSF